VELELFDQVADALHAMVSADLGELRTQPRRWGIKAWFDVDDCPREHYEAQVLSAKHVPAASVLAIEIGFHAEHPKAPDNAAAMAPLLAGADWWREELGEEAVAGETWADPDLGDPEICFEVADRLASYIGALEPLRSRVRS
jgi:hypothetical protein